MIQGKEKSILKTASNNINAPLGDKQESLILGKSNVQINATMKSSKHVSLINSNVNSR